MLMLGGVAASLGTGTMRTRRLPRTASQYFLQFIVVSH